MRLHGLVYAEHGLDRRFEAFVVRELSALASAERAGSLWVAEANREIAGSVALERSGSATGRLRFFVMAPRFAGRGIGQRLLGEALAHATALGFVTMDLWTFAGLDAAAHLYRKAGFRLVEEVPGDTWGTPLLEQRYELQLTSG